MSLIGYIYFMAMIIWVAFTALFLVRDSDLFFDSLAFRGGNGEECLGIVLWLWVLLGITCIVGVVVNN